MSRRREILYTLTFFLSVLDSIGKPESGILTGNYQWFGSFEQCNSITATERTTDEIEFSGQYYVTLLLMVGLQCL